MQRRKAIATAGAVTATATAAVIALGANFGIFGLADEGSKVGKFPAVEATTGAPAPEAPASAPSSRDDDHGREPGEGHRSERQEDD